MKPVVLGIGELLWDLLPAGPQVGGAPANFARHAQALGAAAHVVARVGDDQLGRGLVENLLEAGLAVDGIQIDTIHPTGTVTVAVDAGGQPNFTIHENVAWDHLEATPAALDLARKADALCFGSLAQRSGASRAAIRQLIAAAPSHALRIFDMNLRQQFYDAEILRESLDRADVCKLNDAELPVAARLLECEGDSEESLLENLRVRHGLHLVVCTRGGRGSLLLGQGTRCDHPGVSATVRDTVGAGDAFTAVVAMGLLRNRPLEEISRAANEIAAFVCSRDGATPSLPEALRERISNW